MHALGPFDASRSFPLARNSVQTQTHAGHALQQHGLSLRLVPTSRAGAKAAANATPVVLQRPAHASPDSHQHTRRPEVTSPNHKPARIDGVYISSPLSHHQPRVFCLLTLLACQLPVVPAFLPSILSRPLEGHRVYPGTPAVRCKPPG
ncbi:uncharacterized protein LOC119379196 isoform X1 [Rhipicephalus sanguineus]|uniref:uncharacterized protein LOC119379196 isoform X1 n=1 Tax=Rhipicephalus sanguineus TaxID=34632 RepID=UPI001893BA8A|nr:uncharacterized protein LOC119379196 isoform X1 [Rhipicephalus sanguineus]